MSLNRVLASRPVIYEIVPPRADTSRFGTELRGVEEVMGDRRIDAINIPELINRRESGGQVRYSAATIPPEEYALLVKERKEPMVNIIVPRLTKEAFLARVRRVLGEYEVKDLVLVGKERHEDLLPGPTVLEALDLLRGQKKEDVALGGICIFSRKSEVGLDYPGYHSKLDEHRRMWAKGKKGCDFVTSQINFDSAAAAACLLSYQELCIETGVRPMTVFLSFAVVPTRGILSLLDRLDVVFPPRLRKRLLQAGDMGRESVKMAAGVFRELVEALERKDVRVPLGLQIDQLGVRSERLSLELLDDLFHEFKQT